MNERMQTLKEDVAFIRALTDESSSAMMRDGALLAAAGTIFGAAALLHWLIESGALPAPPGAGKWLWVYSGAGFFVAMMLILRRAPDRRGIAARATRAAWTGVGTAMIVAGVALAVGAVRLDLPVVATGVFPVVLFSLYGAAWGVAFALTRRAWFALVAAGCFAAVVACGWVMGTAAEWLVLGLGLFVVVALPGAAIVRLARTG
jgi:hypothetical protein